MDFVTAISTVGDTETVATEFFMAFLHAVTADPDNWIVKVSHQFVGHCFRALGLNFNVTVEEFSQTQDHPYREANSNYIFDPVPDVMNKLDKFFDRLPKLLAQIADHLAQYSQGSVFDELTHPLSCYLSLIMKWIKVVHAMCKNMQLSSSTAVDRFLCEPLARMSFSFLGGLVKLLPQYGDFQGLKGICLALTVDVRYGIFYQDTCHVVVPPMLAIFRKHYKTFCGAEHYALDFVYCILTVVMSEPDSYIQAYQFLDTMINQFAESSDQSESHYLRLFTNELIDPKFVVLQFEKLRDSNSKQLLLSILKYLMTLQSKLASTGCFSIRFNEGLLQLVLRMQLTHPSVASLTAELYMKISRRRYQDKEIAQHILETYVKIPNNPRKNVNYPQFRNELTRYLKTLIQHFPELKEFEFYACVLTAPNVRMELSLIAVQSASILFELHMAEYSLIPEAQDQVNEFLRCWPYILKCSSSQIGTRSVLYNIYGMINYVSVAERDVQLLINLETCCLDSFLNDDTLNDTEFRALYSNISRSVDATGNIQIHNTASRAIRDAQAKLQAQLNTASAGREIEEVLTAYGKSVRRLHSLLNANKLHVRHVMDIYEPLAKLALKRRTHNDYINLYGSESLALMLVLLHSEVKDPNNELGTKISAVVQELQDFCVQELSSANVDLKRAKFYVCSILIIHISQLPYSNFDTAIYDTIIEILTTPIQESHPESSMLSSSYAFDMHFMFRQLIKTEQVVLPNNRIWKVFLQYKMPATSSKYPDSEIEKLIVDLLECRIESYVHCLPVIQLHIFNDDNLKKKGSAALTAHLGLIDKNSSALDSWLLCYIIFQDSLNLLIKNMRVRRLEVTSTRQRNRLLPLQHLLVLVGNLRLQEWHFMSMAKMVLTLKEEAVGTHETSEIESFITQISKLKYQAEDEYLEATNTDNFEGRLKPLPPGPLNFWQNKTLQDFRAQLNRPSITFS
ncbi:uncharacterized protein LOC108114010 [Drosophila eugracilis]|uniref:uncharacterized protein LOC108114010 n=1 Tax=Drosophila eugracilis TaxID=29029 RepID=UPI0007E88EB2|nr:uncharacterized protein LOC108114010 [Drosophila eugracilis]